MFEWKPYVSVAQRRAEAKQFAKDQLKKGVTLAPVVIEGRTIAESFWGKSWCENLESYSDYANRLPRGRTYARNGSVVDLQLSKGAVAATVMGSERYTISVKVKALAPKSWTALVEKHATHVSSVVDLLRGELPKSLLTALADRTSGLFPPPKDLSFDCSCPDYADMCKHVAAVLYGVGARLDKQPELFFLLRGVEVTDLATRGAKADFTAPSEGDLAAGDLGAIFGIELESGESEPAPIIAKPKAKKAPKAKAPPKPKTITHDELRAKGVPVSTRASWVRSGVLLGTGEPGVFGLTPEARTKLERYEKKR